jgi:hypothetical protein
MCLKRGVLKNVVIQFDQPQFSLDGMLSPTFQNEGTAFVLIDGRMIPAGDSYVINQPGVVLFGKVQITFEDDPAKSKVLQVGYVTLLEE